MALLGSIPVGRFVATALSAVVRLPRVFTANTAVYHRKRIAVPPTFDLHALVAGQPGIALRAEPVVTHGDIMR